VARDVPITIFFRGVTVGTQRADIVVEDKVLVAVRTGDTVADAERYQLLNYLRGSGKEVGLLLCFGVTPLAKRVIATRGSAA
jgi:GxxExxY protein